MFSAPHRPIIQTPSHAGWQWAAVSLSAPAAQEDLASTSAADSQEDLVSADSQEDLARAAPNDTLTARLGEELRRERAADSLRLNAMLRIEQARRHEKLLAAQRKADSGEWLNKRDLLDLRIWASWSTPTAPLQEPQPQEALPRMVAPAAVSQSCLRRSPNRRRLRAWIADDYEPPELTSDDRVRIEEARWWRREQEEIRREQEAEDSDDASAASEVIHFGRLSASPPLP